jgi:hypothetical protein
VPQHVGMSFEPELGFNSRTLHQASEASGRKRRSAFGGEDEGRPGSLLALQPPQDAQLVPEDGVRAGSALLDPTDVQGGRFEVDLIPGRSTSSEERRPCL